jgi:glutamate-1-semialdehyde 2,1-aminomutase
VIAMSLDVAANAHDMYAEARRRLAGGVSSSFRAAVQPEPLFLDHGAGAYVVDVDGRRFLDCALAWGPLILGHCHPAINAAVRAQLERGHMFGAQHQLEGIVAERLTEAIPCADLVTFSNSGTEAMQVAVRLARAATGRSLIVKFEGHYHGWSDSLLVSYHPSISAMGPRENPCRVLGTAGQSVAVLDEILVLPWNDSRALEEALLQHGQHVAAVVMEPILYNSGVIAPEPGYLETARMLTRQHGALLIFDEVITGFRVALGGAQEVFGVVPDLAVYAKAVAAGFPLSVIAGRREVMDLIAAGTVAHSGTYNGNPISLAAADAALDELSRPGIYPHLTALGQSLADGARALIARHKVPAIVHQFGPVMQILFTEQGTVKSYRDTVACDGALNAKLARELRMHGVLILPDGRWYLSTVHTEDDVRLALAALDASLSRNTWR